MMVRVILRRKNGRFVKQLDVFSSKYRAKQAIHETYEKIYDAKTYDFELEPFYM